MTHDLREREFNPLKVLHHVDRLKALAQHRDIAPVTIEIDPVAYCNHACEWCVDPVHKLIQMNDGLFQPLIEELSTFAIDNMKVEGIVFKGGGEPTLHPKFGEMLQRTKQAGFEIGVVTNGSQLLRWFAPLASCASYVRVSIDGPTPESHAKVHKSKDFHEIIEGIKALIQARGSARHPVVGLSFAIDIHTIDLASEAIQLGESLGVDYVLLRPPFYEEVGRAPTMTIEEARVVRAKLRDVASSYRGTIEVMIGSWVGDKEQGQAQAIQLQASGRRDLQINAPLPIEHRTGRCLASPLLAVITAGGELYGCCNLRALPKWSFGTLDYQSGHSLSSLWSGTLRREVLQRMHRTECIEHCTHPLSRYNEMIEVLRDTERPHSQFL